MIELIPLFMRTGNKEALFAVFWATLGREPGKLADVDFATLRDLAERRGVKLTESQVRKRVDELKKLGILDVAPRRERGRFDLYVYRPAPCESDEETAKEPATPLFDAAFGKGVESFADRDRAVPGPRSRASSASAPAGRDALAQLRADSVAVAVSETETKTETAAAPKTVRVVRLDSRRVESTQTLQTPTFAPSRGVEALPEASPVAVAPELGARETGAASLEEINNNKYIKNKTINKPARIFKDETQAEPEARSVADVRSLVDFESPKVAAFRRLVARSVWERTVHPDLIDRIVALAVLRVGGTDAKAVESMIRDAKAEVALWNRTDGRRGQPQIWRALTPEVKRIYENAGWTWSPTRFATEPRPEPRRVAEAVGA